MNVSDGATSEIARSSRETTTKTLTGDRRKQKTTKNYICEKKAAMLIGHFEFPVSAMNRTQWRLTNV